MYLYQNDDGSRMDGWMHVISLVVVVITSIAILAAYNTYPLQHFPIYCRI